jgi:hypothetical protein
MNSIAAALPEPQEPDSSKITLGRSAVQKAALALSKYLAAMRADSGDKDVVMTRIRNADKLAYEAYGELYLALTASLPSPSLQAPQPAAVQEPDDLYRRNLLRSCVNWLRTRAVSWQSARESGEAGLMNTYANELDALYASLPQAGVEPSALRAILDWRMCSDPWPGGDMHVVDEWLDAQSRDLGYSDWLDAYHTLQSLSAASSPKHPQGDSGSAVPCGVKGPEHG